MMLETHQPQRLDVACAVCGPGTGARMRYDERLDEGPADFSARKQPARQHFRVVECRDCGLIYSSPIFPAEKIERLYRHSAFIQEPQLDNMARDYVAQVRRVLPLLPHTGSLLEIGCANGFFLKKALEMGFVDVRGVEPGAAAVRCADPDMRACIVHESFRPELFPSQSFDLICGFQVLDHLLDPANVLHGLHSWLRPGGLVLFIHHNIRSWLARILGERCPMYDVEHIYLFDPSTAGRLLQNTGFEVIRAANIPTSYSLSYALKMFPMPRFLKKMMIALATRTGTASLRIRLPAGNMVTVGRKW